MRTVTLESAITVEPTIWSEFFFKMFVISEDESAAFETPFPSRFNVNTCRRVSYPLSDHRLNNVTSQTHEICLRHFRVVAFLIRK